jgi:hypothetical protein
MKLEVVHCGYLCKDPDEVSSVTEINGSRYLILSDFGGAGEIWILVDPKHEKGLVSIVAYPKRKSAKLFVQPSNMNELKIGIR